MQAIVTIAGSQYRVKQDDTIVVPFLGNDVPETMEIGGAIAIDGDSIKPNVATVTMKILSHGRADKVLVFHKKRRKGYQKLNGHRQPYTRVQITGISA